ncbi:MAG TPA: hypothetical protein VIY72_15375 [Acidimicrobiales bacterium]
MSQPTSTIGRPTDPRPARTGRFRTPGWRAAQLVLVGVVVAVVAWPVLEAARAALDELWRPTGDWAVLNLRVEDVGRNTPLVGPYSRYGWNHPGPLLYWILAPAYHLLGDRPVALLAATGLFNATAVVAVLLVAWRRGRWPLLLGTSAAMAVLLHSIGPALLRDPWNPYVTILPLALFVFLAWSAAEGDRWIWPAAIGVGSFLVQSHVGYAVVVASVGSAAAVMAWRARAERPLLPRDIGSRRALLALTIGIVAVCWAPVALDEVAGTGNLTDTARYFTTSDQATAGLSAGVGQAARHLALIDAPWLGDREANDDDGAILGGDVGALALPMAAFALALLAATAARQRSAVRFQVLVAVLAISGVVATSRITGPVFGYLVRWWWVVACLWWLSTMWSAGLAAAHWARVPRRARAALPWLVAPLLVLVTLSATLRTAGGADDAPTPDPSSTAVLEHLLQPTVDAVRGSGPLLVVATGSVWGTMADSVRLELERNGIEVVASPDDAYRLGPERSSTQRTPVATLWVVSADAATEWMARPEVTRLAGWDPLALPDRLVVLADIAQLHAQLVAAGRPDLAEALATGGGGVDTGAAGVAGVDQDLLARVEQVRRQGDPVATYLGPPTDPVDPRPPWASGSSN